MSKEVIATDSALSSLFTDSFLANKLAGGVHEGEASESSTVGATVERRVLPYLVFYHIGSNNFQGGALGNALCIDLDYYIRVYFDESTKTQARLALLRIDELILRQKLSATVVSTDGLSNDDFEIMSSKFVIAAKSYHRENNGRRVIREGKRWTFRVHGV